MGDTADDTAMKLLLPTERDREAHRKAVEALIERNARLSEPEDAPQGEP